ncbi:hypothetical protein B0T12DRAFT_403722 [Alternaria alternata]|nr:hypothetical protein B0T12DRAFT_403722 [Alternaria alternata]
MISCITLGSRSMVERGRFLHSNCLSFPALARISTTVSFVFSAIRFWRYSNNVVVGSREEFAVIHEFSLLLSLFLICTLVVRSATYEA